MFIDETQKTGIAAEDNDKIGGILRDRRKALRKSMADVAKDCNLSVGFISQVERGISSPSMTSFFKIARALNTTPEALLKIPTTNTNVSKHKSRPAFAFGEPKRHYEKLGPGFYGALMHPIVIHRPKGAKSEVISSVGEEFGYIVSGQVEYTIEGKVHLLEAKDAIHVEAGMTYSSIVLSPEGVTELWVSSYPVVY